MGRFDNQVAIVTGGASGIGFAVAERLAAEGGAVAIIDQDARKGRGAVEAVVAAGGAASFFPADVSDYDRLGQAITDAVGEFGRLDALVNGAGVIARGNAAETTVEEWRRVIDVDLSSAFYAAKASAPRMTTYGGGSIVNIASLAAHRGGVNVAYNSAKGGLVSLTRQLADELAPYGIRVNSVSPGFTATALNAELRRTGAEKSWSSRIPLGRYAEPWEVAAACLFLLSSDAAYITGADLVVDGGLSAVVRPAPAHPGDGNQS
ncbi:MAG: SDR family oxidoreductase [Ectothiorhodospiraceae bacterium]|nr:SDR family oxidoreductase [Ectothiorhodospiraceae bacterium]